VVNQNVVRGDYMDTCEACIGCKKSWNAGRGTSCHEGCAEFQKWESKEIPKEKAEWKPVFIPGAL